MLQFQYSTLSIFYLKIQNYPNILKFHDSQQQRQLLIVQTLTHTMIDSDESYLLKSYNENDPLFANTNTWANNIINSKNSKQDLHEYPNNSKKRWKSSESLDRQKRTSKDHILQLNVPMLDSIYEDYQQNQHTASKIKRSNNKKQFADEYTKQQVKKQPLYSRQLSKIRKDNRKNSETNNNLSEQKYTFKIKQDNFSSCSFGLRQQKICSDDEDLDIQIAQYFCKKAKNQSEQKINQLSDFLIELCGKYSHLVKRLQIYQRLVSQMEEIITEQNKYFNAWIKQSEIFTKKIEKLNQFEGNIYSKVIAEHRNSINIANSQIIHIIQQKIYSYEIQNNQTQIQKKSKNNLVSNNSINFVQPIINYTKSVPVFAKMDNQNTQQTPKADESRNFNYKTNQNTVLNNQNIQLSSDVSQQQEFQQQTNYQKQKIKIKQQLEKLKKVQIQTFEDINQQKDKQKQVEITDFYKFSQKIEENQQQKGETFRRLASFRIKQLETQNGNLINQIQSSNVRLMVIKNQNKELRDIVQQLIKQVQRLTIQQQYQIDAKYHRRG